MSAVTTGRGTTRRTGAVAEGMDRTATRLTSLHEHYVRRVNAAVARGAGDAALWRMSDDYSDAALRVLTAAGPGARSSR